VNNAGLGRGSDVESLSTDDYETMQETNVDGVFYATRAAIPHVREREGHLIFVASFAGKHPRPSNPVYAATKWWVRGFAKSLAAQIGDDDVGITIVNPAEVRSEFGAADGEISPSGSTKARSPNPRRSPKRFASPQVVRARA